METEMFLLTGLLINSVQTHDNTFTPVVLSFISGAFRTTLAQTVLKQLKHSSVITDICLINKICLFCFTR